MAFGIFIDTPLLLIPFFFIIKFRKQIAKFLSKVPLPRFLLYLFASLPFMIFEENINCEAFGCNFTFFPFTIPFLLGFMLILGIIVKLIHTKRIFLVMLIFSIFGTLFEIFFGVAGAQFRALPIVWFITIFLWTMISYAFFTVVPLTILIEHRK